VDEAQRDHEGEGERKQQSDSLVYEEIKFEELDMHEIQDDELEENDELHLQTLEYQEIQAHDEVQDEEDEEWQAHSYKLTELGKRDERAVEEEEVEGGEEYDVQEFEYHVIPPTSESQEENNKEEVEIYEANKITNNKQEENKTEKKTPSNKQLLRPHLQTTKPMLRAKPVLQHWESRELLENSFEREFRQARENIRSRSLPAAPPPKLEILHFEATSLDMHTDAHSDSHSDSDADSDLELDLVELQMESFIVVEYPPEGEEHESNFNFAETYTSKSNKYSVFYH
jgi:hypothetical protein